MRAQFATRVAVALAIATALIVVTPAAVRAQGASAPTEVTAAVHDTTVTLTWLPPLSGVPDYYLIYAGTTIGEVTMVFNAGLVTTVSGTLAPGTYYLAVAAVHSTGPPQVSSFITVTVGALPLPPGAPGNLTQSVNGRSVTFNWAAPSTGGAPTGYVLVASLSPGGTPMASLPVIDTSITVTGVPLGIYYVTVIATNAGGLGAASNLVSVTIAPPQVPGTPTLNPPIVAGSDVTLSWTPASTGGVAAQYVVSASMTPGGASVATLPIIATAITIISVPTGSYYVSVSAVNPAGGSPASNVVVVTVGATVSTLTFTAPSSLSATVGSTYRFPFCDADPGTGFCTGPNNPTGGVPPYHFQLDTLGGFPPFGLSLGLNGTLNGTPTTAGDRTFAVCAVDQVGTNVCRTLTMTIGVGTGGTYQGTFQGGFTETGYFGYWPATCNWNVTYTGSVSMQIDLASDGSVSGTATITGTVSNPQGASSTPTFTCLATTFPLSDTVSITGTSGNIKWTMKPNGLRFDFTGSLSTTSITGSMVTNASFLEGSGQFTTSGTIPVVANKQ
ncbi:MAG TPA: fibronectin type III domain-containing protein [Vicinamibacterales bacterium]|nr:fibronectin type III domain-containing protein [Vicinamibacterales bacterium]